MKKSLDYQQLLNECTHEFKKVGDIWFRRKITKDKRGVWHKVVFSENRKANKIKGIY